MKSINITLGGTDYAVPLLNIGQLEQLTDVFAADAAARPKQAFRVLEIALARATPKVEAVSEVSATLDEVRTAVTDILAFSGMKPAEGNAPGEPAAP